MRVLSHDSRSAYAASVHARDMLAYNYLGHDSPRTGTMYRRVRRLTRHRRGRVAEVVAYYSLGTQAFQEAATLVGMWMNSPPHRAILLDPQLTLVGVKRVRGHFFGRPSFVYAANFYGPR